MAVATATRATEKPAAPTAAELLAKAKELTPFITSHAAANEAVGKLVDEVVAKLSENGFFGLWIPKHYGGTEAGPVEGLEIIEALSYGDGSTGWVVMATQVAGATAAAYLPRTAADEIFGDRIPIFAGVGAPRGRGDPTDGGFRLSGDWSYGSGMLHSEYLHTGGFVYENGEPRKLPNSHALDGRIFIVKTADVRPLGNWDVLGLRATGSIDYDIHDVFVREDYTHLQTARVPKQGGPLYRLGIQGLGGICHAAFALGTARRALDELKALARAETGRPQLIAVRGGDESFQEKFAHQEAQLRAARAFEVEALRDVEASLAKGNDVSVRQFTLMRLALNHVTSIAGEVVAFTFHYGGGVALRKGVLQRCFRDMNAGMQHITIGPNILRQCGLELLEVTSGKIWGPRGLIDPP